MTLLKFKVFSSPVKTHRCICDDFFISLRSIIKITIVKVNVMDITASTGRYEKTLLILNMGSIKRKNDIKDMNGPKETTITFLVMSPLKPKKVKTNPKTIVR